MVNWDILNNEWDNLNGWSITEDGGTIEINPASTLHMKAGSTNQTYMSKDIGTYPDKYTIEFKQYVDSFGSPPEFMALLHYFKDGIHKMWFEIRPTKIRMQKESGYAEIEITNNTNTWYIWRLVVNSIGHSVKVYRDTEYLGEFTDFPHDCTPDGFTFYGVYYGIEIHEDYLRVASGLHEPSKGYSYQDGLTCVVLA